MKQTFQKKRLDILLVKKGLVESRSKAVEFIKREKVKVNGKILLKPGKLINPSSVIEIEKEIFSYVSRGGEKLAYALKEFGINVKNKICLDVGSSTGGFVDCLLKNGAKLVYAIDVGQNQLHPSLKNNKKVIFFEKTDIRTFSLPNNRKVDLVSIDVSFISIFLILPSIKKFLFPQADVIVLFKPQFEVGRQFLNKKGIVKDNLVVERVLEKRRELIKDLGFDFVKIIPSPIKGKKGNKEYLIYLKFKIKK